MYLGWLLANFSDICHALRHQGKRKDLTQEQWVIEEWLMCWVLQSTKETNWFPVDRMMWNNFKELKVQLTNLVVLLKPVFKEDMFLYLFMNYRALSLVIVKAKGRQSQPIYYVSYILRDQTNLFGLWLNCLEIVLFSLWIKPFRPCLTSNGHWISSIGQIEKS